MPFYYLEEEISSKETDDEPHLARNYLGKILFELLNDFMSRFEWPRKEC